MSEEKVAVITDSACDLPREYIAENPDLYVLPLQLQYAEGAYRAGVDISSETVFARMEKGEVPTTSLPSPSDVENIFDELRQKHITKAIFVMMSSGLSGTFNMVRLVCQHHPDIQTEVYDSKILSMGLGYMVMNAVDLLRRGVPFQSLMEKMRALREDVDGMFYLPSLEYLVRGGRIGHVAGAVGKLLNIKPVIGCNAEGEYYARATCIGARRTVQTVKRIVSDFVKDRKYELSVVQANVPEEAQKLVEELKSVPGMVASQILPLGPALSVHVGKGMLAVCLRRCPA